MKQIFVVLFCLFFSIGSFAERVHQDAVQQADGNPLDETQKSELETVAQFYKQFVVGRKMTEGPYGEPMVNNTAYTKGIGVDVYSNVQLSDDKKSFSFTRTMTVQQSIWAYDSVKEKIIPGTEKIKDREVEFRCVVTQLPNGELSQKCEVVREHLSPTSSDESILGSVNTVSLKWDNQKSQLVESEKSLGEGYGIGETTYPQMLESTKTFRMDQGKLAIDIHDIAWEGKLKGQLLPREELMKRWKTAKWNDVEIVKEMDDFQYTQTERPGVNVRLRTKPEKPQEKKSSK